MGQKNSKSKNLIKEQEEKIKELQEKNLKMLLLLKDVYTKLEMSKDEKTTIVIQGQQYDIKEKIGQGGFGVVYKATSNGKTYALKEIEVKEENEVSILAELKFIQFVRESFSDRILPVIKVFGFELIEKKRLFYAMELAKMSLEEFYGLLNSKSEKFNIGIFIFLFVLRALLFLESIGKVHMDIKPENFVLVEDSSFSWGFNIKLIDFGTVKNIEKEKSKIITENIAGTLSYLAPEVFQSIIHKKSDVWALGIMIYRIIYSNFPHFVKDMKTFQSFCDSEREIDFPFCSDYELYPLLSLAKKCLVKNYENRMSAVELYKHTFSKYEEVCKLIIVDPFLDNEKTKTIREKYHTLRMSKGDEREVRSPRKSTPPPPLRRIPSPSPPPPPIKKTTLVIQSSDVKILKSYTVQLRPNEFTLNNLKKKLEEKFGHKIEKIVRKKDDLDIDDNDVFNSLIKNNDKLELIAIKNKDSMDDKAKSASVPDLTEKPSVLKKNPKSIIVTIRSSDSAASVGYSTSIRANENNLDRLKGIVEKKFSHKVEKLVRSSDGTEIDDDEILNYLIENSKQLELKAIKKKEDSEEAKFRFIIKVYLINDTPMSIGCNDFKSLKENIEKKLNQKIDKLVRRSDGIEIEDDDVLKEILKIDSKFSLVALFKGETFNAD